MALHVTYTNRLGYFTRKSADGKQAWKIHFCRANALASMMYFYREEKDGKWKDMVQLWGFFADLKHAEACIKDGIFNGCNGFTFNAKELADAPNIWKLIKLLTKYGIKVTIK